MTKTALVVSGGGAKGAFAVGVLKFISQHTTLEFDLVSGTSTGALMSPLIATREFTLLQEIYTNITTVDVFHKGNVVERFRKKNYLYDTTPLVGLVKKYVTQERFNAIVESDIELFNCCVSLQTGKVIHYSMRPSNLFADDPYYEIRLIKNLSDLQWSIMASANQPVFTPPVVVDPSLSREYCVDGGVRETIPINIALESGSTDIWIIDNNTVLPDLADSGASFDSILDVLKRTIHLFQKDVSYYDVEVPAMKIKAGSMLTELRQRLAAAGANDSVMNTFDNVVNDPAINPFAAVRTKTLHVIRPDHKLAADGGLEFIPAQMTAMVDHGFAQARRYFEENGLQMLYRADSPWVA